MALESNLEKTVFQLSGIESIRGWGCDARLLPSTKINSRSIEGKCKRQNNKASRLLCQLLSSSFSAPDPLFCSVLGDSGAGTLHFSFASGFPARFCVRGCKRETERWGKPRESSSFWLCALLRSHLSSCSPLPPQHLVPASSSAQPTTPAQEHSTRTCTCLLGCCGRRDPFSEFEVLVTPALLCSLVLKAPPVFCGDYLRVAVSFLFCLQARRSCNPFSLLNPLCCTWCHFGFLTLPRLIQ